MPGVHPFGTTIDAPATGSSRLAMDPDGRRVYLVAGGGLDAVEVR